MKIRVLALLSALLFTAQLSAQGPVGLKAGLNLSYIADRADGDGISSEDVNDLLASYQVGVFYQTTGDGLLGLRAELLFSIKGEKDEIINPNATENLSLSYVSLPLALQLRLIDILYLEVGPEFSYLASYKPDNIDPENRFDLGVLAGASVPLLNDRVLVGARFVLGLSDLYTLEVFDENGMATGEEVSLRNRSLQIWAGFRF